MVVFALTLIRHGETAHNKDNVIQGQLDVPLSQAGLKQAELLGVHLQYQQYSHVYASDLARAMQTAESIIRQNKSFKAALLHDRRLRERKFGIVEGKSFKYLKDAAEKSKLNTGHYTPPGGETIQQVYERAVSFFHDLCEMVKEKSKYEAVKESAVNGVNMKGAVENGKSMGQKRKWEGSEVEMVQNVECQTKINSKIYVTESQKKEDLSFSTNPEHESSDKSENIFIENGSDISQQKEVMLKVKKEENLAQSNYCCRRKYDHDDRQFSIMFSDDTIRSQIISSTSDLPNIECPNVSLSPLVDQNFIVSSAFSNSSQDGDVQHERRLSVCSSCDDVDSGPTLVANILVVSHGGWLRELFRHFVEDLECSVPGGKKQALRISPNAGLSKFTVSLEEHDRHPKIICLQIHDKQHLIPSYSVNTLNTNVLNPNEVAL
ncbi:fructose-2,6-bisphosphatase TIGAR-like [Uloborus diversus]|uniref:fructose-2,6-bisphosphatase TIGAR-like n=1 Tax=Uloborus diversus TaxID=327109 RepID=UPI00240A974A|nr:fructose-2,6-bisphosphatase TIGAR-like [Uloborus diversus]XP_054723115.1 fructose-2,6-bisphosphatase TIGAR-like [Uloborus diversus]